MLNLRKIVHAAGTVCMLADYHSALVNFEGYGVEVEGDDSAETAAELAKQTAQQQQDSSSSSRQQPPAQPPEETKVCGCC